MLKRLMALAGCLSLFVVVFFIIFHTRDAQIEDTFRQEREKFHVEGYELTASNIPGGNEAIPVAAPVLPAAPDTSSAAAPEPAPAAASPAPAEAPVDSNTLIGPIPPAANQVSPVPPSDNSGTPATNTTPSSTFVYPGLNRLPGLLLGAYQLPQVQTTIPAPKVPDVPVPAAAAPPGSYAPAAIGKPTPASAPTSAMPAHPAKPTAGKVIVLGYHQFTGPGIPSKNIYSMRQDVFDTEMKYLKDNNYNVIPLSDVVRFVKHEINLPANSVAITIDDGYKSSIVWAAPVLKKYGFPWTFFVYPAFITRTEGKGAASWPDLVELQREGVDIECHSMTHPILPSHTQKFHGPRHLLSPEEYDAFLTDETSTAKAILEHELGKKITAFAYPYGEYNKQVEAKVIAAGFEAVFTVANNPVHASTDIHSIGRYIITLPVENLFASYLRQGALGIAEANPAPGSTTSDPRPVITARLGYAGNLDPNSISTDVRDMGEVRHDFDPQTSTLRLYLPRDLIASQVVINIHAKDAATGQNLVANWHFNYAPAAPAAAHAPIGTPPSAATTTSTSPSPAASPEVPSISATAATSTSATGSSVDASAPVSAGAAPSGMAAPAATAAPGTNASAPAGSP